MTSVSPADIDAYRRDGAVCLRGVVGNEWIDRLREGVEQNIAAPGRYAQHYTDPGRSGAYFGDYCNWRRIPAFGGFALESGIAALAARLMDSATVRFFHEHVLVKEPGTGEHTPWHHDQPYYVMQGIQVLSLWVPLDPVPAEICLGTRGVGRASAETELQQSLASVVGEGVGPTGVDAHHRDAVSQFAAVASP